MTAKNKILFIYRFDQITELIKDISSPVYPKEFLYGMDQLVDLYNYGDVSYINVQRGVRDTFLRKLCYLVETPFARKVILGMPVEIYLEHKRLVDSQDTIVCVNDAISFGILFYKMLGLIDGKVLALFHSLPERLKHFRKRRWVINFISKLLSHADSVLTLSDYAKKPLVDTFRVPSGKLKTFYFGVDVDYWRPGVDGERKTFVLSVGNDMNRDYSTLVEAMPENMDLIIVTSKKVDTGGKPNIKVVSNIPDSELRDLYQTCRVAVIPSVKVEYESPGLSCALQAMACKAPVVISDSLCHREYFVGDEHIYYYEPENRSSLKGELQRIADNYQEALGIAVQGHGLVSEKFSTRNMAGAWQQVMEG